VAIIPITSTLFANFGSLAPAIVTAGSTSSISAFSRDWNKFMVQDVFRREVRNMVQVISAGLAIVFSATLFFTSNRFIESRSAKHLTHVISASVLEMSHQKFLP
jgi:hypothetical protein